MLRCCLTPGHNAFSLTTIAIQLNYRHLCRWLKAVKIKIHPTLLIDAFTPHHGQFPFHRQTSHIHLTVIPHDAGRIITPLAIQQRNRRTKGTIPIPPTRVRVISSR
ncbi:hypothetical protein UUU_35480 [Klebsiella pneumoniae subsp. pneumoniae DSM 30104 = JCM 1662 = NBRC 14940]|nr:hypothetical protein UUU_35480 [Klebsiella pneumoniae subsp. pneumoniae DSM 30104 = JCM 1662 = NBRC 14940]